MEMVGTKPRVLGHVRQVFPEHSLSSDTEYILPPSSSRMTILSSYKWELQVVSFSSHFNILAIFLFLKGVGGAEPFLATNHYKSQHVY